MKKRVWAGIMVVLSATAAFAQGYERKTFKPGETTGPEAGCVERSQYVRGASVGRDEYDQTSGGGHLSMTPIALTALNWGMPVGRNWAICGLRASFGIFGLTHPYESLYGVDVGLSGETFGEAGGILVNIFSNTSRDMYGVAVAGFWNRATGSDSTALQAAPFYNSAEGLNGVQVGLVNHVRELHGLQIGFYNQAVNGGGLQIGIWNESNKGIGSPIIGIVY